MPDSAGTFDDVFITAVDGLRLHARVYGPRQASVEAAGYPVVGLPGLTRTAADFDVLAQALCAGGRRRMIAIDYRGRGQSDYDPNPQNYNVGTELNDVLTMLTALDAMPATIIGTSRGGLIAMALATVRRDALAGVILNDIGPVIEAKGLARIKDYVGQLPEPKSFDDAARMLRALSETYFPRLSADDWMAAAKRGFKVQHGRLVPTYDVSLATTLSQITADAPVPTLWTPFDALAGIPLMVIRGALSDLLSSETVTAMRQRNPAIEVVEAPDQGHAPLLADAATIGRIAHFVASVDATRQAARPQTQPRTQHPK